MTDAIRLFVGTTPDNLDLEAEIALEHSVRSRTKALVQIEWMRLTRDSSSPYFSDQRGERTYGHDTSSWFTPFSKFRWLIPERCRFQGRAIYMDVDQIALADIEELWRAPMKSCAMARSDGRFCVMLMDCERWRKDWVPGRSFDHFPDGQNWNCLDGESLALSDPAFKLLHFTNVPTQPHLPLSRARLARESREHWFNGELRPHWRPELAELWLREYQAGREAGYGAPSSEVFGPFKIRDHVNYKGRVGNGKLVR